MSSVHCVPVVCNPYSVLLLKKQCFAHMVIGRLYCIYFALGGRPSLGGRPLKALSSHRGTQAAYKKHQETLSCRHQCVIEGFCVEEVCVEVSFS